MDFESDYKAAHATRSSKDLYLEIHSIEQMFNIIVKKSEIYTNGQLNFWDNSLPRFDFPEAM